MHTYIKVKLAQRDSDCENCSLLKDLIYKREFNTPSSPYKLQKEDKCAKDESYTYCPRLGTELPWFSTLKSLGYFVDTEELENEPC